MKRRTEMFRRGFLTSVVGLLALSRGVKSRRTDRREKDSSKCGFDGALSLIGAGVGAVFYPFRQGELKVELVSVRIPFYRDVPDDRSCKVIFRLVPGRGDGRLISFSDFARSLPEGSYQYWSSFETTDGQWYSLKKPPRDVVTAIESIYYVPSDDVLRSVERGRPPAARRRGGLNEKEN
jgi:hypothetical protein